MISKYQSLIKEFDLVPTYGDISTGIFKFNDSHNQVGYAIRFDYIKNDKILVAQDIKISHERNPNSGQVIYYMSYHGDFVYKPIQFDEVRNHLRFLKLQYSKTLFYYKQIIMEHKLEQIKSDF